MLAGTKENRAVKPGFSFAGMGAPAFTFQRGTAASFWIANWEDWATAQLCSMQITM
jgi:hypothetical protein